jgi:RNA polymerase sigma-70 factor (ECF subfamily)
MPPMTPSQVTSRRSLAALDDAALVARAARGEESAFRVIMERHNRRLYRVARALLKDDAEAEDAVQEAYLRAFAALSHFRGESSLATWLTRITMNEALGRLRRQRPTVELEAAETGESARIIRFPGVDAGADPERAAAQAQIRALLESSIDALPEPFRVVFVMRDVEELSIEETARFLHIQPATVKTRLHRARKLLRESLDGRLASALKDTFPFAGARCARITEAVLRRMALAAPSA